METAWHLIQRLLKEGKPEEAEKAFERELKCAKVEGVTMFAWWKDGVQYVGTCGTTLEDATKEILG